MKQITKFWNWFQDNEEAIKNAVALGINAEEVILHLNRNCSYISKRIQFLINIHSNNQGKYTIIFTAAGYRKLFPKIIALEEQAPVLKYFIPQAFIKPMQNLMEYKKGTDLPCVYENYKIKISDLQMVLKDYNVFTKQLKIKLYIPNYEEIKQFENLEMDLKYSLMIIIGEIAFKKHIKHIEYAQLQNDEIGLLSVIELPEFIDYLYKINSRQKTRLL